MDSTRLLTSLWQNTLRERGGRVAISDCGTRESVTFTELEKRAASWAETLKAEKLAPGDRVIVKLPNSADFVATFLALIGLDLVMVPVDPKLGSGETATASRHVGAQWLLTRRGLERSEVGADNALDRVPLPSGTVLLKLTSGSTGVPKGIAVSDSQLLADCTHICVTMGIRPGDLNFAAIPLSHSYGFANLVLPLIAQGTPMAVVDEMFPRAIVEGIAAYRATVFPAVPFLLETLGRLPSPLPELNSLRTVISAGAPLSAEVYQRFRERFGLPVHQFYGSSECGGITYDRNPAEEFIAGCVGTPMDSVGVDLVEDGRVRVCGANVASGYFPPLRPGEPSVLSHQTYLTGDLGRFDEKGRLHLVGRLDSFINVAGRKVNPGEVETCIQELPWVQAAVVVGVADVSRHETIAVFVVPQPGQVADVDRLLQHCRTHLASWKVPRMVKLIETIPCTPTGKVDRPKLKAQV